MLKNNGEIPLHLKTKKFSQRLLPARWKDSGPNITATSLTDDYVHFSQARVLTVREWARLQGFPDWYKFSGSRTTGGIRRAGNPKKGIFERELPKYTQIGNAVPVYLAEKIGSHFLKII
jgi:DNA (cytosine-5)-methyltransferase 1